MNTLMLFLIVFVSCFASSTIVVVIWEKRHLHECSGTIVMYEDQIYLSLTKEDMEAFQKAHYATLRLQREKFQGFNENC